MRLSHLAALATLAHVVSAGTIQNVPRFPIIRSSLNGSNPQTVPDGVVVAPVTQFLVSFEN